MALLGLGGSVRQVSATYTNNTSSLLVRIAAYSAAVALIACAAAQNTSYGWALGSSRSEIAGYIMAGGALAAAIMAPICLSVAISGRGILIRLAALFLALWTLAFGISASLGFVSMSREAMSAERVAAGEARRQAAARHDAAAAELAQLAGGKASPWKSKRSAELQKVMADATTAMKMERSITVVDPQASAISHYLAAAGFQASPASVATWTTAFTTAFFEVAGAFSLAVAAALRKTAPEAPRKPADVLGTVNAGQAQNGRERSAQAPQRRKGRRPSPAASEGAGWSACYRAGTPGYRAASESRRAGERQHPHHGQAARHQEQDRNQTPSASVGF